MSRSRRTILTAGAALAVVMAGASGPGGAQASHSPGSGGPPQTVVDLVYQPVVTPLLAIAAGQGAVAVDGIGMLVHQAALAITHWTGAEPDIDAMQRAARS